MDDEAYQLRIVNKRHCRHLIFTFPCNKLLVNLPVF